MNFTSEQLKKAQAAKSADEILALAKESGVELTVEEAAKYFAELHKEGVLPDDELNNVSGGCGGDDDKEKPQPKYHVGQMLLLQGPAKITYTVSAVLGYYHNDYQYELSRVSNGEKGEYLEFQINQLFTVLY